MTNANFQGPPGTNPPRHQLTPIQQRPSMTAWIAGVLVAILLIGGGVMLVSNRSGTTTTAQNTPSVNPAPPDAPLTPRTIPAPAPEQRGN